MLKPVEYVLNINDNNRSDITNLIINDNIKTSNKIKKIEIHNIVLGRYNILKIYYIDSSSEEYPIRKGSDDEYQSVNYIKENGIDITNIITNINICSLIFTVIIIILTFKRN